MFCYFSKRLAGVNRETADGKPEMTRGLRKYFTFLRRSNVRLFTFVPL